MNALIHSGVVRQLSASVYPVHPSLEWVECDDSVGVGWLYHDGIFNNPVGFDQPEIPDVELERDRRLALASFTYDFGDDRGIHVIGTDEKDMKAWMDEVMPIAQARLALGDATPINIVTNTGPVSVTPTEWMGIVNTGGAGRQAIWQYYFALIAMDPIPSDYQDDQYWSPPPEPEE